MRSPADLAKRIFEKSGGSSGGAPSKPPEADTEEMDLGASAKAVAGKRLKAALSGDDGEAIAEAFSTLMELAGSGSDEETEIPEESEEP